MPGPHTQRSGKATSESPRPKEQTLAPRNTGQVAEKARRPRDIRLDHRHRPALDVGLVAKEAGRLNHEPPKDQRHLATVQGCNTIWVEGGVVQAGVCVCVYI